MTDNRENEVSNIIQRLRNLAHKRGKGSIDPIWDDIAEMEAHARLGQRTMFAYDEAVKLALRWLHDE